MPRTAMDVRPRQSSGVVVRERVCARRYGPSPKSAYSSVYTKLKNTAGLIATCLASEQLAPPIPKGSKSERSGWEGRKGLCGAHRPPAVASLSPACVS